MYTFIDLHIISSVSYRRGGAGIVPPPPTPQPQFSRKLGKWYSFCAANSCMTLWQCPTNFSPTLFSPPPHTHTHTTITTKIFCMKLWCYVCVSLPQGIWDCFHSSGSGNRTAGGNQTNESVATAEEGRIQDPNCIPPCLTPFCFLFNHFLCRRNS